MPSKNVKDFLAVNSLNLSTASILAIVGGELKRFTGQTIVIDSSGNVGIGTTTPTAAFQGAAPRLGIEAPRTSSDQTLLSLAHTGTITALDKINISFDSFSSTNTRRTMAQISALNENPAAGNPGSLLFYTNLGAASLTERMRIDSNGNVGIGTGTTSPVYRLSSKQSGNTGVQSLGIASINSANDTFIGIGYDSASDTNRVFSSYVSTGAFKPISFWTADAERLRIDSSGNVGIGITTPLVKTHIRYARSGGVASDTIAGLFLDAYHGEVTAPTVGSSIYLRSSRSATLGTQVVSVNGDDSRIRFYFSDGTNFVPAAAVNGSVDGTPAAGSVAGKLLFLTTSAAATAPSTKMTIDKAGIVTITNLGTGTVSSTAGVLSAASDARMKISDGEIENAINKIQNLKPKYFYWKDENNNKDESKGRQLGFFAQEVNEQVPEAAPGLNDQWGIYDRSLIAVLVKAVQELKVEIDILKNK